MAYARNTHWLAASLFALFTCLLWSRFWPFETKNRWSLPWTYSSNIRAFSKFDDHDACENNATTLHLSDPPYENFFYYDCHSTSHVVVTSPLPSSDLSFISPRLLVAWPAGNSGLLASFAPENGANGSLALSLWKASPEEEDLKPIYFPAGRTSKAGNPRVGISGVLKFNSSAALTVSILGSVRTMRDFIERGDLEPVIQNGVIRSLGPNGSVTLSRLWLDNTTTTELAIVPYGDHSSITTKNDRLVFTAGLYIFNASYDYEQLAPLNSTTVLNPASQDLIAQHPDQVKSLAFLSYSEKVLAGTWRFLTYFGRDSMISLLLLQPILSEGERGAIEAVISSVLERINGTDGTVCHEETIGDFATLLHLRDNITSNAPLCNYNMIDTDYLLPIVMQNYLLNTETGRSRAEDFLSRKATLPFGNQGTTYANLAILSAEKIMATAAPFVAPDGQIQQNLQQILPGEKTGQWRDSWAGLGGGSIPFDVNAALIPAALRAISAMAAAGLFPSHPEWPQLAASYAQVWEEHSLSFFEVTVPAAQAKSLLTSYISNSSFPGPSHVDDITDPLTYYALSLNSTSRIPIMHTDTSFHLFLLNTTTAASDAHLTRLLDATASHILLPYPAGLLTPVGLLVANPAYAPASYTSMFSRRDYHGTVVWGWPMAMMAKGLERQLGRCSAAGVATVKPGFCSDAVVYGRVKEAYNKLWDVIDANNALLSQEVWSWEYTDGGYKAMPLGAFSATESDIIQLWSLAYLAVTRNQDLR